MSRVTRRRTKKKKGKNTFFSNSSPSFREEKLLSYDCGRYLYDPSLGGEVDVLDDGKRITRL